MKPTSLGTILPTKKSIEADNRYSEDCQRRKANTESTSVSLRGTTKRFEKGEWRFYISPNRFATISHDGRRVLWFECREDGDYAVR